MSPKIAETSADKKFGRRIRELRESRGIKQGELGEWIGVNQQQMSKYEDGSPFTIARIPDLCKALDTTPNLLFEYFETSRKKSTPLNAQTVEIAKQIDDLPKYERDLVLRIISDGGKSPRKKPTQNKK